MNDCPACESASKTWPAGIYHADCIGCTARMLSESPDFHESYVRQMNTRGYMQKLWAVFGKNWEEGHQQVRRWQATIQQLRKQ